MNEETKEQIQAVLSLLKTATAGNGVSIALKDRKICFFDTDTYLKEKRFDGFSVSIDYLVGYGEQE